VSHHLDKLSEGSVKGRTNFDALVEIDRGNGAFGNAFGGEFEFLPFVSATGVTSNIRLHHSPCKDPCKHQKHQICLDQIARASTFPSLAST
jgi:hypothetical protein